MDNEILNDYVVTATEGISVQGVEYPQGSIVSLNQADAESFLQAGAIATPAANPQGTVVNDNEVKNDEEVEKTEPTLKKYKVLASTVYSNHDEAEHAEGEVIELDPTAEQTKIFLEGSFVEEVTE